MITEGYGTIMESPLKSRKSSWRSSKFYERIGAMRKAEVILNSFK